MKPQHLLISSIFLATAFSLTITGCSQQKEDSTSSSSNATAPTVKATPPPNFNPSGDVAAQQAAAKATAEVQKQIEGGKK